MSIKYILGLLGFILAIPLLILIVIALNLPISIFGILYLLSIFLVVSGLASAPFLSKQYPKVIAAGATGFILIAITRIFLIGADQLSEIRMVALPEETGLRWIGSIIDEQDALIFGEAFFHAIGGDSAREHEGLESAFKTVYEEIRSQGVFPSPVAATYLSLQKPEAFDAIIIEPATIEPPAFGVIFLHGYMGNVTAQCWVIAHAVKNLGGLTICPSTEWTGRWWLPEGQEILNHTFAYLEKQGISKFFLGGFSNGGFSIGRIGSELGHEKGLAGIFFIDGFMNGASIKKLGLPVLIIEGIQDERVPPLAAQQFAEEVGEFGTYVEINSDHFLIIKQPEPVQNAITEWLKKQIDK